MTFRCLLCPQNSPPYQDKTPLLDHIAQVHLMDENRYLDSIQASEILPETSGQDPTRPSADEQRLMRQYQEMGLNPADPRLARACFLQATIKRKEEDIRLQPSSAIDLQGLKDLQTPLKQAAALITELLKERDKSLEKDEGTDMLLDTLQQAENHIRANAGDFQFRCGQCDTWVNTDGLPVWMLIQGQDHDNPLQRIVMVGNSEIFYLIRKGDLSLSAGAFITRTSPEALVYTAEYRGDPLVDEAGRIAMLQDAEISLSRMRALYEEEGEEGKNV